MTTVHIFIVVLLALIASTLAVDGVRSVRTCTADCLSARGKSQATCLKQCSEKFRSKYSFARAVVDAFEQAESEAVADDDDEGAVQTNIWEAYRSQLFQFLKRGGNTRGMQLLQEPVSAVYDKDTTQTLADILNPVSKWGAVREEAGDEILPVQYFEFIDNIQLDDISPDKKEKYEQAKAAYEAALSRYENAVNTCKERYELYKSKMTYEQFAQRSCYSLSSAKFTLASVEFDYQTAKREIGGKTQDVRDALAEYAKFVKKNTFPWKESFITTLKSFRSKINNGATNEFRIVISKTSLDEQRAQQEWKIPAEDSSVPFLRSQSGETLSLRTSSDDFKMEINAAGYAAIDVSPESWFKSSVIQNHRSGPFKDTKLSKEFFGKNGKLSMVPKMLYMLYKPTITLQVDEADKTYFRRSSTINLGPFRGQVTKVEEVGSSESGESEPHKIFRVTVQDKRTDPLIVAVDNEVYA